RPDSNPLGINPLGGRRETNLPGAEGERPDSNPLGINPLGGRRETNLPVSFSTWQVSLTTTS
ncbi:hypothetical protein HPA19_06520, partial [Streptococcus suis]|nr:hypothetical protein [Streptococcus suis]